MVPEMSFTGYRTERNLKTQDLAKNMKRITSLILAALLVGCGTTRDQRCQTYRATYELCRTASLTRNPTETELDAANAAAVFLTVYCGWIKTKAVDINGVPVVVPGGER